jgi:hypothetical protein
MQREYLYVYDRVGGRSGPGIKKFVSEEIQSIENTETKFDPREQIELSRSGEIPENPYLFDPNKPIQYRRNIGIIRGKSGRSSGPKYIYQCNYCGKKSTKTKRNSSIRQHKDKSGYKCSGRSGFYIDTQY